ncbi:hypothetical protein [Micromonospora sp. NPDC047527]|uniref:hypothetical protein n=1 Tax=Micromonospora sp. NPDC047527 TaxID=3155144 RepID=UPI0033F93ADA
MPIPAALLPAALFPAAPILAALFSAVPFPAALLSAVRRVWLAMAGRPAAARSSA